LKILISRCASIASFATRVMSHGTLDALAVASKAAVGDLHEPRDDRRGEDAKRGEPPVHVEHHDQQPDDGQAVADDRDHGIGGGARHEFDVVRELRQQMPRLLPVEIGRREPEVVCEDVVAQSLDHLPSDPARVEVADEIANAAQGEQHDHGERHLPDDGRVAHDEGAVQERLDQIVERRGGRREKNHAEDSAGQHPLE